MDSPAIAAHCRRVARDIPVWREKLAEDIAHRIELLIGGHNEYELTFFEIRSTTSKHFRESYLACRHVVLVRDSQHMLRNTRVFRFSFSRDLR